VRRSWGTVDERTPDPVGRARPSVTTAAEAGGRADVEVLALSGGSLADLTLLGAAGVVFAGVLLLMARMPRLAFAGWLVVLCFVPVWVGITFVVGLEGHVVATVGLVLSVLPGLVRGNLLTPPKLTWGDALFAAFLVVTLVAILSGRVTFSATFVACVQWAAAFLAGRLVGYRVRLSWVYGALAVAFTVVAALALVEFAVDWNPFLDIPGEASLRDTWGIVEFRGGGGRTEGAFGHSIAVGASLALAVPITLVAPFRSSIRLSMLLLMLSAAVVTFSRIGLVTAVLGAVLSVLFLRRQLPRPMRVAATVGLVVVAAGFVSLITSVFAAAGTEATNSADYRLQLLGLIPDLQPFGWASTAYQIAGRTVLANVQTTDGSLQTIDNALLLVGLSYGWVPLALLLLALLVAACMLFSRQVTAPTIALVAQIPAFATVALITQYSTFTWFVAGLAVFSQSVTTRESDISTCPGDTRTPSSAERRQGSPELVGGITGTLSGALR
jgi:hypothetical protein